VNKKMIVLTTEALDLMPPDKIFMRGSFIDSKEPGDDKIALCFPISNKMVRWVAVRGDISDWCIFCENPHYQGTEWEFRSFEDVKNRGDKIIMDINIKKLVPCTDEAFKRYRY
jgi:hypothetical protein